MLKRFVVQAYGIRSQEHFPLAVSSQWIAYLSFVVTLAEVFSECEPQSESE